jgi:hypothetical protein
LYWGSHGAACQNHKISTISCETGKTFCATITSHDIPIDVMEGEQYVSKRYRQILRDQPADSGKSGRRAEAWIRDDGGHTRDVRHQARPRNIICGHCPLGGTGSDPGSTIRRPEKTISVDRVGSKDTRRTVERRAIVYSARLGEVADTDMNNMSLVKLYPRAWRDRYEDEFTAMLEQEPGSLRKTLNILFGIVDAHLYYDLTPRYLASREGMEHMWSKLRRTYSRGLVILLLFVVPCLLFNAMLDDSPFIPVMRSTPVFRLAYWGFLGGTGVVLFSTLAGGSVILWDIFRRAISRKRRDVLLLFFVPVVAFLVVAFLAYCLNFPLESTLSGWIRGGIDQSLGCLFLLISTVCVYSILRKGELEDEQEASRSRVSYKVKVLAPLCVTLGMVIASVSAVIWGFMAGDFAPRIISNSNWGLFHMSTLPFYVIIVLIIVIATAISGVVAVQGVGNVAE